ncbi:MAG: GtrA family protein [Verrucomicrobiales bacterium]|nr:GtrA family protein [Verrucomicrobiales bacterium]
MSALVTEWFAFFFRQSPATSWRRVRDRDMPWVVQLTIYGVCGALATVIAVAQVVALSKTLIPAYEGMLVDGAPITDALRARNLLINNTIAFFTTNVAVYFMNVLLVFQRGRHHPWLEFFFFTLINGISFILSQVAGPWLVHQFGVATNVAILTNAVFSALINFVARKFFVFKG